MVCYTCRLQRYIIMIYRQKMRDQINFVKLLMMLGSLLNSNLAKKKENELLKGQCKLKPLVPRIFGGNEATPRKYTVKYNFRYFSYDIHNYMLTFSLDSWPWLVSIQVWQNNTIDAFP